MSINIGPPKVDELRPRITVIGVGGAGGNAIANMINAQIEGVDFVVANTDAQALNNSIAEHRIQLGPEITQGLGAGARPEVGRAAAEETLEEIERALEGAHMCFIAAGMGGGTGTGAAPVIAKTARDRGVLTVGVVTKPFLFEGTRRMRSAESGIEELQKHVDTLIVIPNQNLFLVAKAETTFKQAFELADEVLQQGVRSITDLMVMPGLINLDFADVRSVMGEMGKAMMGTGEGEGQNRALDAAEKAISNPLLDGVSMQGAKGVIISIIGGEDMKLLEVDEAANHIRELVDPNANIIWGSAFNPDLGGKIRVSVVATGIEQTQEMAEEASRPFAMAGSSRGPVRPGAVPARGAALAPVAAVESEAVPPPAWTREPAPAGLAYADETNGRAQNGYAGPAGAASHTADETAAVALAADSEAADALDLQLELDEGRATSDSPELLRDAPSPRPEAEVLMLADRFPEEEPDPAPRISRGNRAGVTLPRLGGGNFGTANVTVSGPGYTVSSGGNGGTTLFERMANIPRNGKPANAPVSHPDDDGEGAALSIPRFLGRQNNQ